MIEVKLRNFRDARTGETTQSFEVANEWVKQKKEIICCACYYRGPFFTYPIEEFDIENQTFTTTLGHIYKVVGMDDLIRKIIVKSFIVDMHLIGESILDAKLALDEGKKVVCKYLLCSGGIEGITSKIKLIDVENSKFVTETGSIYFVSDM